MADGGNESGLITAGALKRVLITLPLGNIAPKAHQAMSLTYAVIVRHFTNFKAGFAPIRVVQPLFIGERDVMTEYLLVGFNHLFSRLWRIHISRL